ncbi:FecCD family ABC transporter permease [Austwickia chelonae]|uniref:FecCD family ABC transporter permease n=1 Tax=Austwickia chelonae TaxID=100225 RepID=UPI000E2373BA|nr:iron ABC transporter permease [Austwickia chelonae]
MNVTESTKHPQAARRTATAVAVVTALIAAAIASIALGNHTLAPGELWQAVTTHDGSQAAVIVHDLRLPRTLLGLTVGAALGVAGVLAQSLTRNSLADPGLLGVSAGSALAVVLATATGLLTGGFHGTAVWAFAGALGATTLVFGATTVADRRRSAGASDATLPVIGIATSAALSAVTSAIVLLDARSLDAYRFWAIGALAGRTPDTWLTAAPLIAVGLLLAVLAGRGLDAIALGDDLASGLGVDLRRLRLLTVTAIALLTGTAVAACGPLAFVGLLVAHTGRALVGPRHSLLLPLSAPLGACAVLTADVLGRLIAGHHELATGVVLGLVGGPLFALLVARKVHR